MFLRFVFWLLIGLFGIAEGAQAQRTGHRGYLHADGQRLVDNEGKPIILRGMGLGGWMLQEGYMFKLSNLGQQHRIRERIQELVGPQCTEAFYTAWLDNHTTRKDIEALARWGFNSVRLPMHYRLFTLSAEEEPVAGQNTWLKDGFARTDSLLAWCQANRLYLILDMHAAPGGQGHDLPISDRYPDRPSLWESAANRDKMVALWKQLAQRYARQSWIGGYDIINEPNWGFTDTTDHIGNREQLNAPLRELMVSITKAIRAVDTNHLIIIEGNAFGNNYKGILPTWDKNMALSFHKYGNFNNTASIQGFLDLRKQYNVPLWMGESGENSNTWFTEAVTLVESNGIGWAWWQEKKMGISNPVEIREPEGYQALLDYWQGKGPKPSADETWRTLQGLLKNIRYENNVFHPDVVDALFRQVRSEASISYRIYHLDTSVLEIPAVDYGMGRQRAAYYDLDSARYQYTPGVKTQGNRGGVYRNDGVDIKNGPNGPYVFSIEAGEWLNYPFLLDPKIGAYRLSVEVAGVRDSSVIQATASRQTFEVKVPASATGEPRWTEPVTFTFYDRGQHNVRLLFEKGGFDLLRIRLEPVK